MNALDDAPGYCFNRRRPPAAAGRLRICPAGEKKSRVIHLYGLCVILLAVFVAHGLAGCRPNDEQGASKGHNSISLAVTPWPASAPIYVAHEKGYFKDEALDLHLIHYLSGHLGLNAALSGKVDLATAGETPIVRAALEGRPVSVISTLCEIDRAVLIIGRKDRGITAARDLKGKKIGVVKGTTADFFLHYFLVTSYIEPTGVRIVSLQTDQMVKALLDGQVDAVSTWAPHTFALMDKLGSAVTVLHDDNIYSMTWNIAAAQDFINHNPESIRKFLRAILRANRFISEQPSESLAILMKRMALDEHRLARTWKDFRFALELDQSLVLNLEDQARWMSEKDGTGDRYPVLDTLDIIDSAGLKAVNPEAVRITGE